jgi:hypothetical protein
VGVLWIFATLAWCEVWVPDDTIVAKMDTTSITPRPRDILEVGSGYAPTRRDLYGNEIDEAVGDYRIDERGEIYERHSPDTAVLKLKPAGV